MLKVWRDNLYRATFFESFKNKNLAAPSPGVLAAPAILGVPRHPAPGWSNGAPY